MTDKDMSSLRVPSFCPICGRVMRGSYATRTYYDFGCCDVCHVEFIEGREERWKSGWRPDADQVSRVVAKYDTM